MVLKEKGTHALKTTVAEATSAYASSIVTIDDVSCWGCSFSIGPKYASCYAQSSSTAVDSWWWRIAFSLGILREPSFHASSYEAIKTSQWYES